MLHHVAIIMDGNGRYAQSIAKLRSFGHYQGAKKIHHAIQYALSEGVQTLSLFAFSTENWNRPDQEVQYLLELLTKYVSSPKTLAFCQEHQIQFLWKGFADKMDPSILNAIHSLEAQTAHHTALKLAIMFNYGGQAEIIAAINNAVQAGQMVDATTINQYLLTGDLGPIDLLIRTGGKQRISNFMLYNLAYTEIYFCDTYWPQFSKKDWNRAVKKFRNTKRTFGRVDNGKLKDPT